MNKTIEEICLDFYKSIKPTTVEKIIPIIDFYRKLKNKPAIPLNEKLVKIDLPTFEDKVIMLHAVSVGEVMSLENLIKKIKAEFSNYKIVLTTGTLTGQELAHKKYSELADFITYLPLDIYESCEKFLKAINPSVILMAETELWPNFALCAKENNIPLYVINGRISDKSYPSYLKIKNLFKLILSNYSAIFCQSELDKDRFIALGADKNTTKVMKNLKFEIAKKECDIDLKKGDSKIFIAASTHKGEDIIAIRAYKKLKQKVSNLKFILAPRHLTRLDEIKKIFENEGLDFGLRTQNDTFVEKDIIILDTLGELSKIYDIVDVAYIGGSFNSTGGHNPLEATIYSKPTVSGPSIKNFRDIYAILEREKASFVVKNEIEFYNVLNNLLTNDEYLKEISSNCETCFQNNQGALEFVIEELRKIL